MTEPPLLQTIQNALRDLRFGTVELIVHEGHVVRIERIERIRLPSDSQETKPTPSMGGLISTRASQPPFKGEVSPHEGKE